MLKRFNEKDIEAWYRRKHRKPLVVRGARQVGKSTLIRNFASNNRLTLHEINLERHPGLVKIFNKLDIDEILKELEYISGKGKINTSNNSNILFLDEIQAVPSAIKALRYFFEDYPGLPLIAAGSLLEFSLSDHSYSMPVGRIQYLYMGPMTFEEFLLAKNEKHLLELIGSYNFETNFPESAHQKLLKYQREYLMVGGMPEAIQIQIETGDFNEVMNVHSSIIETYRDDFAKYAKGADLLRLHRIFDYIPSATGEKAKYSNIDPNEKARELRKAIGLLEKANVISCVYHSKCSGLPLKVGKDDKVFKMFFLDIGLMNRICGIQNLPFSQLEKREFINEGKMAEQFIQQHLLRIGRKNERPELFYWLREARTANAEIDFVVQLDGQMVPVEVKAGTSGSLKSLHRFIHEKKLKKAVRFDLNPPSIMDVVHQLTYETINSQVAFKLMSLPLYMVEQLPRLLP
ncbi:MAG: ATP-binding protein [Candidatus Aminicenantes bacterium]|nr:MAG: ATP-binding protein [Candidatus Aminicenantes bacterium]